MDLHVPAMVPTSADHDHVDPRAGAAPQAPELGRAAVAQKRTRPTRVNSSDEGGASAHGRTADGVHASVHHVKAPAPDPVADRISPEAEAGELQMANYSMLPSRHLGDREINWLLKAHV
jgi:hypothetical protein